MHIRVYLYAYNVRFLVNIYLSGTVQGRRYHLLLTFWLFLLCYSKRNAKLETLKHDVFVNDLKVTCVNVMVQFLTLLYKCNFVKPVYFFQFNIIKFLSKGKGESGGNNFFFFFLK